jgi:hypothetical protein
MTAKRKKTGGRTVGTPNKVTKELKDMVLTALDRAGGINYLQEQAEANPNAFLTLVGKVLPLSIKGDVNVRHIVKVVDLSGQDDSGDD